jgi:hypothetical protein
MCPTIIVLIIIAMILFMPAIYSMGIAHGMVSKEKFGAAEPPKCTVCAKMKYCMNPSPAMEVFCK